MHRMEEAVPIVPDRPAGAAEPAGDAARANAYSLLARLLVTTPDEALLALLRDIDPVADVDTNMAGAWQALRMAAQRVEPSAVDHEYHALFIGLGRGELVPYGSWYLTGFMMDQPLAVLRADLTALGFERQEAVREPEDHVAALCEVMALLASEGEPLDTQQRFFQRHMDAWITTFCLDLQKAKTARFYRAVGALGEAFFRIEKKYLMSVM